MRVTQLNARELSSPRGVVGPMLTQSAKNHSVSLICHCGSLDQHAIAGPHDAIHQERGLKQPKRIQQGSPTQAARSVTRQGSTTQDAVTVWLTPLDHSVNHSLTPPTHSTRRDGAELSICHCSLCAPSLSQRLTHSAGSRPHRSNHSAHQDARGAQDAARGSLVGTLDARGARCTLQQPVQQRHAHSARHVAQAGPHEADTSAGSGRLNQIRSGKHASCSRPRSPQ